MMTEVNVLRIGLGRRWLKNGGAMEDGGIPLRVVDKPSGYLDIDGLAFGVIGY